MRTNRPWQSLVTGNPGTLTPPANGSWLVPDWWVDPSNSSGVASDSNVGNSSASPLLHYAEIVRRWQTLTPVLRQATTVHFMSSHLDDSDPVIGAPYCVNGSASLVGVLPAPVATGGLTSLSHQTRGTAGNFWMVEPPGAGWGVGSMIVNTTRANSRSFIYSVPGEATPIITQPRNPTTVSPYSASVPARNDAWANGDTVNVYNLFSINVEYWCPIVLDYSTAFSVSTVYQLEIGDFGQSGLGADMAVFGPGVAQVECYAHKARYCQCWGILASLHVNVMSDQFTIFIDDGFGGFGAGQAISGAFAGLLGSNLIAVELDGDIITKNTELLGATLGAVANDSGNIDILGTVAIVEGIYDATAIVWSPNGGILNPTGRCRFQYPTANAASASLLMTLKLGGKTVASAYDDTADPALWHAGRLLTAANLDADVSAGGFRSNGVSRAIDPAGAAYISVGSVT